MTDSSSGSLVGPAGSQLRTNKPQWMIGANDLGQEKVFVLRRKLDETECNGKQNQDAPLPDGFIVGASIEARIGIKEARTLNASREGRGSRYILRTSSITIANKLCQMTELTDRTKIEIVPHPTLNTVQGMVYDPDSINKDETSILDYLKPQGVHAVRRIKKRESGTLKNTPLLVLSFHGTILPEHVYFGLLRTQVRTYYPSPMLCYQCGLYGHSKKFCQQTEICLRCSEPHDVPEGERCNNPPYCHHCKSGHQVTSRDCLKYKQEEKIIRLKTDQRMSFSEARRVCAEQQKKKTLAGVVQGHIQQELAEKDKLIVTLQRQVATLARELGLLKRTVQSNPQNQSPASREPQPSASNHKPSQETESTTSRQQNSSQSTDDRLSRKDQSFISPPARRRDNRKPNKQEIEILTRSKSVKRQMDISPTEATNRGKRTPTEIGTSNSPDEYPKKYGPDKP